MAKVYIAGPMTGYDNWNFPAFFEAQRQLESLGYEVINPAHNDGDTIEKALESAGHPDRPNHAWSDYMRRDLPHVMEVDMLCLLPGWRDSRGAQLEVHVARALGLPLMVLKDGKLIPRVRAIGLSGWARSGKDTVADYLVEQHGYVKVSFADPIRESLRRLNPRIQFGDMKNVPLSTALGAESGWEYLKEHSPDIRPLMQRMGTEVGREMFHDDFWVDAAIDRVPDGALAVFSDARYPNEADAIRKLGGKVYRVTRFEVGPANDHPSETALDQYNFDGIITNDSTISALEYKVGTLV